MGNRAVTEGEFPGMRDAFAGLLAFDDVGCLQKLFDLFPAQRGFIRASDAPLQNDAGQRERKVLQASGKVSHKKSSENCLDCTPARRSRQLHRLTPGRSKQPDGAAVDCPLHFPFAALSFSVSAFPWPV